MTIMEFANIYGLSYGEVRRAIMRTNNNKPKNDYWNEKNVQYSVKELYSAVEEYILYRSNILSKKMDKLRKEMLSLNSDNPFEKEVSL